MTKGQSRSRQFLVDHLDFVSEECLIWPFSRTRGYGQFGYLGKGYYAHRYMCELKRGPAPSDIHEAAHSCGNNGCVNPAHLSWKTPSENMMDCRGHGTHIRSRYGNTGKLTQEEAQAIRALKGVMKLREIADQFGISESAVSNIWVGRTYSRTRNIPPRWAPDENAKLKAAIERGRTHKEIAEIIGRPRRAVATQARRLGLKSQWVCPWASPLPSVGTGRP